VSNQQAQAIECQPGFATGVAIIDDQHRVFIKMLNQARLQLSDHILQTDKKLGAFIRDRQAGAAAAKG